MAFEINSIATPQNVFIFIALENGHLIAAVLSITKRGKPTLKRISPLTALVAIFVLFTGTALAQSETGSISGTVLDPTGATVPGAKVTIKNVGTNASRSLTTNADGIYTATNLHPSDYSVTVEASGFSTERKLINVAVGGRAGLDIKLSVGQTGTTIEVAEASTTVNTVRNA